MSSSEPRSVVSVGSLLMTLMPFAHTILPPFLQLDPGIMAHYLAVDLCFYQLLDEDSVMTVRGIASLIIGDGQFGHPVHYS